MQFQTFSFRHAEAILREPRFAPLYKEIKDAIEGISDADLIEKHTSAYAGSMSLSKAINALLRERLVPLGWNNESPIFQDKEYKDKTWRLDFAKDLISIEVAFNHGEAIAWNLLKPVMASELNHVEKAIQTEIGIVIMATRALKAAGAFDGAVGEYEKFKRYLTPLRAALTVPILLIGLEAPQTFSLNKKEKGEQTRSKFVYIPAEQAD